MLQDIHGGCAQLYLKKLFGEAKRLKSEIIVCYSPFAPYSMIDILLIPDAKICFAAESENILFSKPADKIINARRFTDNQKLSRISAHLKQNRKAAQQLYFRSKQYFEEACCCRHKMEEIYSYFFDTTSFDKIRQSFFANIM